MLAAPQSWTPGTSKTEVPGNSERAIIITTAAAINDRPDRQCIEPVVCRYDVREVQIEAIIPAERRSSGGAALEGRNSKLLLVETLFIYLSDAPVLFENFLSSAPNLEDYNRSLFSSDLRHSF